MSKFFKLIGMVFLLLLLVGCQLTTTSFLKNQTNDILLVSVKQQRDDLGWGLEERESITLKPNHTCNISTDPYYDSFMYIKNTVSGKTTNVSVLNNDEYIYSVSEIHSQQVVSIAEAENTTIKVVGRPYETNCVEVGNE